MKGYHEKKKEIVDQDRIRMVPIPEAYFHAEVIAGFLGIPAGHVLARRAFRGKLLLETLMDLPMTMTPLVAGVGLLFLLGSDPVRSVLDQVGIEMLFTPWGAILAQTLIAAPIMTRTGRAAFAAIDIRYEQAARTLGLTAGQIFFRVTLPIAVYLNISSGELGIALVCACLLIIRIPGSTAAAMDQCLLCRS
jgi:molybdate transport system permease protein